MLAVATSKGDGSTGLCNPIGQAVNSGETTYPLDACATANARAVDGESNSAISIADKAKAFSLAERGKHNTAVTRATNGGDIIWNITASLPNQPTNPHAGRTPDCPWPLPPLPQAQQACGNATAKASYGDRDRHRIHRDRLRVRRRNVGHRDPRCRHRHRQLLGTRRGVRHDRRRIPMCPGVLGDDEWGAVTDIQPWRRGRPCPARIGSGISMCGW